MAPKEDVGQGSKQKKGSRDMLEAYFVSGAGEFVEEFFVYCKSVYLDSFRKVWVCERVSDTSDGDGESLVLRVPDCFSLNSVSIVREEF